MARFLSVGRKNGKQSRKGNWNRAGLFGRKVTLSCNIGQSYCFGVENLNKILEINGKI
jgi:hypothetical protein